MFRFKRFSIDDSSSSMKVGTDGVLLGAWVDLPRSSAVPSRILDVGTGCGVIAIMIAQRASEAGLKAEIEALDIDVPSMGDASANIKASPWGYEITPVVADFRHFETNSRYDLIISNPPFFINSLKAPQERRSAARHTDSLPYSLLAARTSHLLQTDGRFAVVLPADEAALFEIEAGRCGLFPCRRCLVSTKEGYPCRRVLTEYSFERGDVSIECLAIQNESDFTDRYKSLTKEFYLKF